MLDDMGRVRDVAQLPSEALLVLLGATDLEARNGQVVRILTR